MNQYDCDHYWVENSGKGGEPQFNIKTGGKMLKGQTYKRSIEKAVNLLDSVQGKSWPWRVNLARLTEHDSCYCVLGQLYKYLCGGDQSLELNIPTALWKTKIKQLRKHVSRPRR